PLVRRLAPRYGLVDYPHGQRKLHGHPTPVGGGFAILFAVVLPVARLLLVPNEWRDYVATQYPELAGLPGARIMISIVGVLDDFGRLRGRHKLLGQVAAIAVLIGSGLVVRSVRLFGLDIDLGLLAVPFTAFFLLGAINSLNMLDGMDGLLSLIGLIFSL